MRCPAFAAGQSSSDNRSGNDGLSPPDNRTLGPGTVKVLSPWGCCRVQTRPPTVRSWRALPGRLSESPPPGPGSTGLRSANRTIRDEFGRGRKSRWIERYGFVEHKIDPDSFEDGRSSHRKRYGKVVRERPGLAPAALLHLNGNSVFLRLSDVAGGLPPYEERVLFSFIDTESGADGYSQRLGYDELYGALRAALADALSKGSRRQLVTNQQTLLAYPTAARRARRSSTRTESSCSCRSRRLPRTASTQRSGRSSTS